MKQNFKLVIAYDGSRYYGWEHQPNKVTIQGKLEDVLNHLSPDPVLIIGAGRTDAGVHARQMVANVVLDIEMGPEELMNYMNQYLPDDIAILDVRVASDRFHARYNVVAKTYCYTCFDGVTKPVFDRKYVWTLSGRLNIDAMKEAAQNLIGKHDYMSFCKNPQKKKSTVREIYSIDIVRKGDYVKLSFRGSGFLRNMVRILTGTLVDVGLGTIPPARVQEILLAKDRTIGSDTAPAQGLCLMNIEY